MTSTLWALVGNGTESLMRVTGLMRRMGCSISKISMEECEDGILTYLSITIKVGGRNLDNIMRQMRRFHDVHEVGDMSLQEIAN